MFQNIYPIFERKHVLKKEMLENLRDYPRTLFQLQYQDYSDGILYGCSLEAAGTELAVKPGILLYHQTPYFMETPCVVSCEAQGRLSYLKVCFSDREAGTGHVKYCGHIYLDEKEPDPELELEFGRFKLQPGARLRTEYVDFADYVTEFDTVDRIHVPYAAPAHPTVWPQLLKRFAAELLGTGTQNALDCAFCMSCMQTKDNMPYDAVKTYLNVKLKEERDYTSEQTYHALKRILEEAKGSRKNYTAEKGSKLLMI
ncbi:hypothetical protein C804_05064 [Lachnospiraceae bacterium A4]|jgi:hypothetical protein|nr:hypothetical protein C804_05064 [Lachnospiraceae bacterium A4]